MFYSPSTGGFYATEIHGSSIPEDAVEITAQEHADLLQSQSTGKRIVFDEESGKPVAVDPPPPEPYVPQQVTRAQGKSALIQAGLWGDVLAFVDGIADPTEKALAEVALHDTTHWQRTSPFLNAAATALGLTSQQLDDLFTAAWGIEL